METETVSLPVNWDRDIQVNKCILGTKIDLQSAVPRSSCSLLFSEIEASWPTRYKRTWS